MSSSSPNSNTKGGAQLALVIGALGVVFGDIGTSPLYALDQTLANLPPIERLFGADKSVEMAKIANDGLQEVVAWSESIGGQLAAGEAVRAWLRESLPQALEGNVNATGTELRSVNLITGVTGLSEMKDELRPMHWDVHVVTSPEDRPNPERANLFVRSDKNLVPLSLLSTAVVAGLMPGQTTGPFDHVALRAHLESHGIAVHQEAFHGGARGMGHSFYVHDPFGNKIEIKGPGDPGPHGPLWAPSHTAMHQKLLAGQRRDFRPDASAAMSASRRLWSAKAAMLYVRMSGGRSEAPWPRRSTVMTPASSSTDPSVGPSVTWRLGVSLVSRCP
jgi:hypothetical protein